ncbi:gliding motility protein GldN [Bernardetia sp. ABR2-2B]|uniref:type IX secretion system ring protein PorN/GldN n=1 Tax=Bernardetia sp. ABR2-2B TaxID=3127472 RepID=UPI0030D15E4C
MKKLFYNPFTPLLVLLFVSTSNFCLAQSALSPETRPNETAIGIEKPKTEKIIQDEINPFSLRPIPKSHIAFQKSIWLQVSLKQKSNLPLWYAGHELSKFLIENALNGKITPYRDDKLESVLSKNDLLESLKVEETAKLAFNSDNFKENDSIQKLIDFSELSILEIKEDYILDIQHSRMIHDVLAFTLILPANKNRFRQKIVSFSYKEIIEKLYRPLQEDYVVIETTKSNGHIPNLETLIDSRFFHGYIVKYDNFKGEYFEDQYDGKREAFIKCMQYHEKLIEFESCLWTY